MMGLSIMQYNLLVVWLPAVLFIVIAHMLRFRLASKLRWKEMVLRLTATHSEEEAAGISDRERTVLTNLLSNVTLLSALGSTLALTLLCAPTEIYAEEDESGIPLTRTVSSQYFIFFSFASTATFMIVVIESALAYLYLEQYNNTQLHALLCEKAAVLFVEPLLAFVTASFYMLVAGVIFCASLYGPEAGIGLSVFITIPLLKVGSAWHYMESFDRRSYKIAKKFEKHLSGSHFSPHGIQHEGAVHESSVSHDTPAGHTPRKLLKRTGTVVGQSMLLQAMKAQQDAKRTQRQSSRVLSFMVRKSPTPNQSKVGPASPPKSHSPRARERSASPDGPVRIASPVPDPGHVALAGVERISNGQGSKDEDDEVAEFNNQKP